MAGKNTVFEVKINYITTGEPTDGWVKQYTKDEFKTVDELINDMLSELDSEYDRYDVDVLLQYSEGDDPALVFAEKARLIAMGNRVFASVALPDKLRYARLVRFGEDK